MLGPLWEALAARLSQWWLGASAPALVFWLGAALAWAQGRGGPAALGAPLDRLAGLPGAGQAVVLAAALVALLASVLAVETLVAPVLRLLTGSWPPGLAALHDRLVRRQERRLRDLDAAFQQLAPAATSPGAAPAVRARFVQVDQHLRRFPADRALAPTAVGNVLRAAEATPAARYGLDAVAVWAHLWLVLPAEAREALAAARAALDRSVAAALWGLLFLVFSLWAWWVPLAGLAVVGLALRVWLPSRAAAFADLVVAAFDLHRPALYAQLRWPLPASPAEEPESGRLLTEYLVRGSDRPVPVFTPAGT